MSGPALDIAAWSSRWRHRDPVDKALLCGGLTLAALLLPAFPASPAVLLVCLGLALGPAGVPAGVLLRAARTPLAFVVLAALPVAVGVRGWPHPGIEVTAAGLGRAGDVLAHALAGAASVLLLATTTPVPDLLARARSLGVPAALLDIAAVTYRLLFLLLDSVRVIDEAQAARLGHGDGRRRLRSAGVLVGAVLARAWQRARRLEDGLQGRGARYTLVTLVETAPSSRRFVTATAVGLGGLVVASLTLHAACTAHLPGWVA